MTAEKIEPDDVAEIVTLHGEVINHLRRSLDAAVRIGELLTQRKAALAHGDFIPWIRDNMPFSDRTARRYMYIFEKKEMLKTDTMSDLTAALQLEPNVYVTVKQGPPVEPEVKTVRATVTPVEPEVKTLSLKVQQCTSLPRLSPPPVEPEEIDNFRRLQTHAMALAEGLQMWADGGMKPETESEAVAARIVMDALPSIVVHASRLGFNAIAVWEMFIDPEKRK